MMLTKIRGDARKDMYMSDNTMWGDPTSKKDKFALISKGLIDMPLDDNDPNHLNLIKYGAKVAIKAMKACARKGQEKRINLVDNMSSIGEIKFYLSNASGYGAVNYPNIIFRKKDES